MKRPCRHPFASRLGALLALLCALLWVGHAPHGHAASENGVHAADTLCVLCAVGGNGATPQAAAPAPVFIPLVETLVFAAWDDVPREVLLTPATAPRSPPRAA